MSRTFRIMGIIVEFMSLEEHSEEEAYAYVKHISGLKAYSDRLHEIERIQIRFEEDDAVLEVVMRGRPFERLRRITGYLVGTTDRWNDGKKAELDDRVKHGL